MDISYKETKKMLKRESEIGRKLAEHCATPKQWEAVRNIGWNITDEQVKKILIRGE